MNKGMLLTTNCDQYAGKVIACFEDKHGNVLKDLSMLDSLVIVFKDGERIYMRNDLRGNEYYFSQYDK
jgi:hypothetical protein